jgi:hypothetical protein
MNEYFVYGNSIFARTKSGKIFIIDTDDEWILGRFVFHERNGYLMTNATTDSGKRVLLFLHRIIVNPSDCEMVDHKNLNKADNRKRNLRVCTRSQNMANRRTFTNSTTGVKGVFNGHKERGKPYRAQIKVKGKAVHLGYFDTIREARHVYNTAAVHHFGDFARVE